MTHTTHQALRELDRVAARVEAEGLPFDMGVFGRPDCGTPGCIAGWAMCDDWFKSAGLIAGENGDPNFGFCFDDNSNTDVLARFFALSGDSTWRLFFATGATITDQRAVIASLLATVPDRVVEG